MGIYYYVDDPESESGHLPIYEDDYIAVIFKIAEKSGVNITNKMILTEVKSHWKKPEKSNKKRKNKKKRDENN